MKYMGVSNICRLVKQCEVLLDIGSVFLVFFVLKRFVFVGGINPAEYVVSIIVVVMFLSILDSYNELSFYTVQRKRQPLSVGIGLILSALALTLAALITERSVSAVGRVWITIAACYPVMLLFRWLLLSVLLFTGKSQTLLILYDDNSSHKFLKKLMRDVVDYEEIAIYNVESKEFDEIEQQIRNVDSIVFVGSISNDTANKSIVLARQLSKSLCFVPTPAELCIINSRVSNVGDTLVLGFESDPLKLVDRILKRVFDICASLIGLILLWPFFALIAAAVKIDTEGPAFYKQERYTINKKRFHILKFRTMINDAEKNGIQLATEDDSRITRVGRILRRYRIDELPQLINILKGEMSFVGPRPERPVYADEYSAMVKNYDLRYIAKAGLTGFAQVYGRYNTKASDKVLFDWIYINKFSNWLDFKLIVQSFMAVFIKESSIGVKEEDAWIVHEEEKKEAFTQ